jgi:hypothetical protein
MAIQMETRVFQRIIQEREEAVRRSAVEAIADTMEETNRFGWANRTYITKCARGRLEAHEDGQPWDVRKN